jgi:hypothetical protein
VTEERQRLVPGWQDERCANGLLAEVVVHDPVLDTVHERFAEPVYDGGINPGGHQPKRIPGGDEAVVRIQVLEPGPEHSDVWQPGESLMEYSAHCLVGVDQPETFEHIWSCLLRRTPRIGRLKRDRPSQRVAALVHYIVLLYYSNLTSISPTRRSLMCSDDAVI